MPRLFHFRNINVEVPIFRSKKRKLAAKNRSTDVRIFKNLENKMCTGCYKQNVSLGKSCNYLWPLFDVVVMTEFVYLTFVTRLRSLNINS